MKKYKMVRIETYAYEALKTVRIELIVRERRMFNLSEAVSILANEYLNKEKGEEK